MVFFVEFMTILKRSELISDSFDGVICFLFHFDACLSDLKNFLFPRQAEYTGSGFSENFPRHLSLESLVRNHSNQFEMSELHSLAEKSLRKKHALKST